MPTRSLSQGQRDWDLLLEVGKSLHPWPVYVMGWVGYRWREVNREIQEKPGDERLFYAAAGGSVERFRWKLAVDGLFGRPPVRTDFDLVLQNDERELVQVIPTVGCYDWLKSLLKRDVHLEPSRCTRTFDVFSHIPFTILRTSPCVAGTNSTSKRKAPASPSP